MIARKEILAWLHDIADEDAMIAVDEGGLTLVVVDSNGLTTNASLEIG